MEALIAKTGDYRRYLYVAAGNTGLRKEELHALRRRDFDISDPNRATVRLLGGETKNNHDTALPVPASAVAVLKTYLEGLDGTDTLVFPTVPNPKTFDADLIRAGIKKKTSEGILDFHALRYYYATALARAGVSVAEAQRLLRHADPRLTLAVYTRLGLTDMHAAAAKLDAGREAGRDAKAAKAKKQAERPGENPGDPMGPWGPGGNPESTGNRRGRRSFGWSFAVPNGDQRKGRC